ncbi:5-oxoprolinase subunit PxpA [Alteromonas sp. ASW11-19]|uniref:5-oxoprolinase subunit PxpA n=1 Tax=Alteromonas salexigens TaxID=2982530 RepID=A0ABT2VNC8_9ALTE|nr:5-oxoprolinase subunit PxpA [Alteromonas salexigens]MCU7553993.1 5-oxoprolinase subunit PxpA [Alteromonas salexigens]
MKLNCDLGESYGAWSMPVETEIMVYIDQANIACGFHAGDPVTLKRAIALALEHDVAIGAHPSYPDLQGFGRRSMSMKPEELKACLHYQIAALAGLAKMQGGAVSYVKPHGALYNDLMQDVNLRKTVMQAIYEAGDGELSLMIQAHPDHAALMAQAKDIGINLIFEAFADRRYTDEGYLVSRHRDGAVLSDDEALTQAERFMDKQEVVTESGAIIPIAADSLCVHGDSPGAVDMARKIRLALTHRKLGAKYSYGHEK